MPKAVNLQMTSFSPIPKALQNLKNFSISWEIESLLKVCWKYYLESTFEIALLFSKQGESLNQLVTLESQKMKNIQLCICIIVHMYYVLLRCVSQNMINISNHDMITKKPISSSDPLFEDI